MLYEEVWAFCVSSPKRYESYKIKNLSDSILYGKSDFIPLHNLITHAVNDDKEKN